MIIDSYTQSTFSARPAHTRAFFIPPSPFSIWEQDTFLWASDERYMRHYAQVKKALMAKADFLMDGKLYTIACEEKQGTYASLLAKMIQTAVAGEKDKDALPLVSVYHLCKDFFTNELTSRFRYSSSNIPSWVSLERGIPYMFALFLIVYPILCKDPVAEIEVRFECNRDSADVLFTPHCEIDLERDILHSDFVSSILRATLKNAEFSIEEETVDGIKKIRLSSKYISRTASMGVFDANADPEIMYLFTTFLAFCVQNKDFSE